MKNKLFLSSLTIAAALGVASLITSGCAYTAGYTVQSSTNGVTTTTKIRSFEFYDSNTQLAKGAAWIGTNGHAGSSLSGLESTTSGSNATALGLGLIQLGKSMAGVP
jgi:hypothetical protein